MAGLSGGRGGVRRHLKRVGWLLLALSAALVLFGTLSETGRYLARGAWEEARILARRRPIREVVADSATSQALRGRLALVLAARDYAARSLGLRAGESFTTYSRLDRDTLVLVLSGARRDTLAPVTWTFPVVGEVPYKGFFDFPAAHAAREALQRRGFATSLRPAAAFSTLGWFNDPLLSTTVRQDTLSLVNTVIHELLHNTLFVASEVAFNESLASFVGARGAAAFFRSRGHDAAARAADTEWEDDKQMGAFWQATATKVDSAFALPGLDSLGRIAAADSVYAGMRRVLLGDLAPRLSTIAPEVLERLPLDNASLLARRLYARDLWLFDEVHRRSGGDLRRTVTLVGQLVRATGDPWEALRAWLARPPAP